MSDADHKRPPEEATTPPSKKTRAPLITIRGTRLSLRQRAVGWDRTMPVLKAVLAFQSFLGEASEPLAAVPTEHLPLIASLAQESDKSAPELAKSIKATVAPEGHAAVSLDTKVIQDAISVVADRCNYGIEAPDTDIPATLQLWRWEVRDDSLLPDENREKLLARREERILAKGEAQAYFDALPADTRESLVSGKKAPRPQPQAPDTPKRDKLRDARRAERQAREDKEEKGKQAQAKMFGSFFQRPTSKTVDEVPKTDFEATFPPCEYKNIAPINRFYRQVEQSTPQPERTAADLLCEFKQAWGQKRHTRPGHRGIHPPLCVRDVMQVVRESDVLGGNAEEQAKCGLEKLNNPNLVRVKLLQFQTDRRPGWFGTWTRSTNLISARRPFGQDPMALDYNYDSDAEWEEGDEGENVEGVDDREDEESIPGSESDSEMDDWLEDDLEEADDGDEDVVPERDAQHSTNKSKKKKVKWLGRRFDSKLVPYISGPHFETTLGVPAHEPFDAYRVVFLNGAFLLTDASPGLDPLTFEPKPAAPVQDNAPPSQSKPVSQESTPGGASTPPSRTVKSSFPDTHLPELLARIEGSTRPKPVLLEELREHFAPHIKGLSKVAIEARLNECAMRESKKLGARWVIRDEFRSKMSQP